MHQQPMFDGTAKLEISESPLSPLLASPLAEDTPARFADLLENPPEAQPEIAAGNELESQPLDPDSPLAILQRLLFGRDVRVIRIREAGVSFTTLFCIFMGLTFNAAFIAGIYFLGGFTMLNNWPEALKAYASQGGDGASGQLIVDANDTSADPAPAPKPHDNAESTDPSSPALAPLPVAPAAPVAYVPPVSADSSDDLIAFSPHSDNPVPCIKPSPLVSPQTPMLNPPSIIAPPVANPSIATPVSHAPSPGPSGNGDDDDAPRHTVSIFKPGTPGTGTGDNPDDLGASAANKDAQPVKYEVPSAPIEIGLSGKSGKVVVDITVNTDGSAGDVKIIRHSTSPTWDNQLLRAMRRARFIPAYHSGVPVVSHFTFGFPYGPDGENSSE